MRDHFEDTLFRMAQKEQILMPKTMSDKIDDILCKLSEEGQHTGEGQDKQQNIVNIERAQRRPGKSRSSHRNRRKTLVLVAALTMLISATAVASVGAVRERMEAMNRKKIEAYFAQIYTTKIGHDNYNRPYSEEEKKRMGVLREAYEKEARFPKGEIAMIDRAQDYRGKGVAFLGETTTFFFPEREMSDEELLQVIDFMYKRDYSLGKMNELIQSGEAGMPEMEEPEIKATDEEILLSEAVYEPRQALTIPYTGTLELDLTVAAGRNGLYLAGWNCVHRMEIGSSDSELFFDDFGVRTRVLAMCQDAGGDVYMALWQWPGEDAEERILSLWVVSKEGELLRKMDMAPYIAPERQGYITQMAIDGQGYLYLKAAGLSTVKDGAECEILVLDQEGGYVSSISGGEYFMNLSGGLCVGKDGKVYTQIGSYYDPDNPERPKMGIASVDVGTGTLADIYFDIVPEGTIMLDVVAPGAESDFVFWGYDGIFTYNLGEKKASHVLHAYEAPCDFEGARHCALPDGRIVLADCNGYRTEETQWGKMFYAIPEKICFYYLPGI